MTHNVEQLLTQVLVHYFSSSEPLPNVEELSVEHWSAMVDAAKRNEVGALLYDAVLALPPQLRPPKSILFALAAHAKSVETQHDVQQKALRQLATETGMPCTVVKGARIAALYPVASHRESTDVDLYTASQTDLLSAKMENMGHRVERHNPRHDVFQYEKVTFEAHRTLFYNAQDNEALRVYLASVKSLDDYAHAIFVASHAAYHADFFLQPIPLKQLFDWWLLVTNPSFSHRDFQKMKSSFSCSRFADLLTTYCCTVLLPGTLPPTYDVAQMAPPHVCRHFDSVYRQPHVRHTYALRRVVSRSAFYVLHRRLFRWLYGQSPFRKFYIQNLRTALRQHIRKTS